MLRFDDKDLPSWLAFRAGRRSREKTSVPTQMRDKNGHTNR
jgi:hypothetical protein